MIPFLLMLELISKRGQKLSEILRRYRERYFITGELNTPVDDVALKLQELKERFGPEGTVSHLDGLSVDAEDWHMNVRPSNTEPLLRLNLEALSPELMERKRDEVLEVIRSVKEKPPFRFSAQTRVGFSDTDAQGIVYYGRYLPYFDLARVEYHRNLGLLGMDIGEEGQEFVMRALHDRVPRARRLRRPDRGLRPHGADRPHERHLRAGRVSGPRRRADGDRNPDARARRPRRAQGRADSGRRTRRPIRAFEGEALEA